MRIRSKAREIALCILYDIEVSRNQFDPYKLLEEYFTLHPAKKGARPFATQIVEGTLKNIKNIDEIIKKYVRNWQIERMAVIDRNILRMGCFEILYREDIPPKVSINEAVELAKRFGDVDSPRFVNGILDRIYKQESKKGHSQNKKNES